MRVGFSKHQPAHAQRSSADTQHTDSALSPQDDDARRRTRIADLHAQRSVLCVLGVIHCPLVEDLAAAHAEFGRAARTWPDALVARCAAFGPSEHHLQAAARGMRDLMMFPAGGF